MKLFIIAHPDDAARLRLAAETLGHEAVGIEAGESLPRRLASFAPDAVVLSLGVLRAQPLRALQRLRALSRSAPVVALYSSEEQKNAASGAGGADVLLPRTAPARAVIEEALSRLRNAPALARATGPAAAAGPLAAALGRIAADVDRHLDEALRGEVQRLLARAAPRAEAAAPVSWRGDLSQTDVAECLGLAFRDGTTGTLRFTQGPVSKTVGLWSGRPVFALSDAPSDALLAQLVATGRLTADEAARAALVAGETAAPVGAVLIDQKLIGATELKRLIDQQQERIIVSLGAWKEGHVELTSGLDERDRRRARGLRHPAALAWESLILRARGEVGAAPAPSVRAAGELADAELARELWRRLEPDTAAGLSRLPELLDRLPDTAAVAVAIPCAESTVLRALHLLRAFGAFDAAAAELVRDREARLAALTAQVEAQHAVVRDGTYFDILGLGRDCTTTDVDRAWSARRAEIADERLGPELARTRAASLSEVREALDEARAVLRPEALRAMYRDALLRETEVA